jgi:hypothetical protein
VRRRRLFLVSYKLRQKTRNKDYRESMQGMKRVDRKSSTTASERDDDSKEDGPKKTG